MSFLANTAPQIWVDLPQALPISHPIEQIGGWIGIPGNEGELQILCEGFSMPVTRTLRPDLEFRDHIGFSFF